MSNKWDRFSIIWLAVAIFSVCGAIVFKHIAFFDETFNIISGVSDLSAIFGVIYVICAARQERKAYLFGIVNVILYAIAVFYKGLYISAGYNLLYSFPVLIYGYIYWGKLENSGDAEVRKFSAKARATGVVLMSVATVILALFSQKFLGGSNVWMDSVVSVCVCVATFLLARKYIEQWWLFIISNFLGILLFLPKSFNEFISVDLFTMWVIYFINSIYGYISWKKYLNGKRR